MDRIIEYQPIVDEFIKKQRNHPLILRNARNRRQKQCTLSNMKNINMPDTAPLEAEWTDAAGYHRAPVTDVWESESGSVVLTVGAEQIVPEYTWTERMY